MPDIAWTWLFIDAPAADAWASLDFWAAVSETVPTPWRGDDDDEFARLLPAYGDGWLKFQRVDGPGGIHLDLDVADPAAAGRTAVDLGATIVHDPMGLGHTVMASPGGFVFCLTTAGSPRVAAARTGANSRVDQACLDIPPDRYDVEVGFWAALTGWSRGHSVQREEFHWMETPASQPVRLLLQRLDDAPHDRVRAHLDIACRDRAATTGRHHDLGATTVADFEFWTVMRDPTGMAYCLTDRDPVTGRLAA